MAPSQTPPAPVDSDPAQSAGAWLRPGRHLLAGLGVLLLGIYFSVNSAELERERELSDRRADVQRQLSDFRARLERDIYAKVSMARGLGVNVVVHEGIAEPQFETVATELMQDED